MVPGAGLEPAHCCQRQILSLMRLPISPPGHEPPIIIGSTMLRTDDFDYSLPQALIAQTPPLERAKSRLLVLNPLLSANPFTDAQFTDLTRWVRPGDVFVLNDTRVLKARLFGQKPTGGQVECLVERPLTPYEALVQFKSSHAPKAGGTVLFEGGIQAVVLDRQGDFFHIRVEGPAGNAPPLTVFEWMECYGQLPLPPYIERPPTEEDAQRYQTVYARHPGAVAAPTAGLHFDEAMLEKLKERGAQLVYVTLHVGAGTFQPVRVEYVKDHIMHSESYDISQTTVDAVMRAKAEGRRITAIGTTSLRALESAALDGTLRAGLGDTHLFITPGFHFNIVDRLFTNFHLPRSTLLMLVSAFAGTEAIRNAYEHAIAQGYRFFSYGDALLMDRAQE